MDFLNNHECCLVKRFKEDWGEAKKKGKEHSKETATTGQRTQKWRKISKKMGSWGKRKRQAWVRSRWDVVTWRSRRWRHAKRQNRPENEVLACRYVAFTPENHQWGKNEETNLYYWPEVASHLPLSSLYKHLSKTCFIPGKSGFQEPCLDSGWCTVNCLRGIY